MVTARKSRLSKILQTPGPGPRIIAPTTTRKIAQRMVSASRLVAAAMPHGFYAPAALDTLLILYVAEDDARYLKLAELDVPGATSRSVIQRWVAALVTQGLIEERAELLALSERGYRLVTSIIEAIYTAQRELD